MVKIFLFALVTFSCGTASAQTPVWSQFPNSPGGTTRNDDIFFASESTGWSARGTDGVYKTTDGGNIWVKAYTNTSVTAHFRCIGFASTNRGWAGNLGTGSYDGSVTDTNVLYETSDGGQSWSVVPGINQTGMKGLCAMHVLDPQHIYGGGRVRGPACFVKTENGGASWFVTNLTAAGVMGGIMDVYFKDATNGFVVGMDTNAFNSCFAPFYHGAIARTTNGGLSWSVVANTTVNCSYFWKMSWPSPNTAYASLQQNASYNTVIYFKSTDGGATWSSNGIPLSAIGASSFFLQGIGFVSENEGWMGGTTVLNPPFSFIHTTNGGLNWTTAGYNNTRAINRIRFLSPTLGYAAGQALHVYRLPLAITNQPQGQWVSPGVNVAFNVGVYGNPPFAYQWRKDGASISSATNASLTLSNVVRSHSGNYSVVVTNISGGSLTSDNAQLRVSTPQRLTGPNSTGGGQVNVLFSDNLGGAMNSNYIPYFQVQASSNLVDWEILNAALSVTNGKLLFYDSAAYPRRFYRVLEH